MKCEDLSLCFRDRAKARVAVRCAENVRRKPRVRPRGCLIQRLIRLDLLFDILRGNQRVELFDVFDKNLDDFRIK